MIEKLEQQKRFDEELIKAQQEIQDETLKQVGQELHDNIGQLLALTSMHLNVVRSKSEDTVKKNLDNATDALKSSIEEVRALSKSLNGDVILRSSFNDSLKDEVKRLEKLGTIEFQLSTVGEPRDLSKPKDRLMLFRIIQEFISNALKHSEATIIDIKLNYTQTTLEISIKDNGLGFNPTTTAKGSGLINMEKRAKLINAQYDLSSKLEDGTRLELGYHFSGSNA